MNKMNILCITDKAPDADHSAVEGIFCGALQEIADVYVVFFCRKSKKASVKGHKIILPHRLKRANIIKALNQLVSLSSVEVVIVRNYFSVLRRILSYKKIYKYRVGFWESFPHSFRRIFQAKVEDKSVLRKTIEYKINQHKERKLLGRCDFYLPITETYKQQFYSDLAIPYHPLTMGVDFSKLPPSVHKEYNTNNSTKKFVYIGAVDKLRKLDEIISAFWEYDQEFLFGIYTGSRNSQVEKIKSIRDIRICVHEAIPRSDLFKELLNYDIGIGLYPENDLYRSVSPTKTLEYYALGIPAIMNRLDECTLLFDEHSAFFCDFSKDSIKDCIVRVCRLPIKEIRQIGNAGREIVKSKKDYNVLSFNLLSFLENIVR
jgi:hypothetical protein